jgi:outer membrane protein assembly factor BamD (BamD/ComL family)
MSLSGISSNNLFELLQAQNSQSQGTQSQSGTNSPLQQIEDEFTQLGQDLQSGNLTQAQQDFTTLSSALSSAQATPNSAGANPVQQAFTALQQDLQNGNLSGAQQDFAALQQGLQQTGTQHHHHHHHNGGSQQTNAVEQDFNSLAQALQSGDLNGAQTAFASLQQDLQQLSSASPSYSSSSGASQSSSTSLNVSA